MPPERRDGGLVIPQPDERGAEQERPVSLTVAMPTLNRRELALATLASVLPLLADDDEVIVVDNDSTDGTVRAVRDLLTGVGARGRVLVEKERSVSRARNLAIASASNPFVCFVDDDEIVDSGWLEGYRAAWAAADDRVAAIGGPVDGLWEAPRPRWLTDPLLIDVSVGLDLGPRRRVLDQNRVDGYIWGGNMSLRRDAALAVGGFSPNVGPRAGARLEGREEADLEERLADAGWDICWDPVPRIKHRVPAARLSRRYMARKFAARGRAEARQDGRQVGRSLAQLGRSGLAFLVRSVTLDDRAFQSLMSAWLAFSRLTARTGASAA